MLEDHFELHFAYIRSKMRRLQRFFRKLSKRQDKSVAAHEYEILEILEDKLEPEFDLSKDNLYVKIMDEGLDFPESYSNLIQKDCLV